jgi:hypothetical protein
VVHVAVAVDLVGQLGAVQVERESFGRAERNLPLTIVHDEAGALWSAEALEERPNDLERALRLIRELDLEVESSISRVASVNAPPPVTAPSAERRRASSSGSS